MSLTAVLLFVVLPYIAIGQLVPAILFRKVVVAVVQAPELQQPLAKERSDFAAWLTWCGVAVLIPLHLIPLLFPGASLSVLSWRPLLVTVELVGWIGGALFLVGMVHSGWRRIRDPRFGRLRSGLELATLFSILASTFSGVVVAVADRWGSAWYTTVLVPYLRSLILLRPEVSGLSGMGYWPQAHVATSFLALALLPFSTYPPQWIRSWFEFWAGAEQPRSAR
ncbi:MAG TPA: respiratory nitrate reductase subunit gamma [Myxococcaceae bacterium]|nr:respiratory nitrate reductase subunit gamma [Myxococcaceae bacterium]